MDKFLKLGEGDLKYHKMLRLFEMMLQSMTLLSRSHFLLFYEMKGTNIIKLPESMVLKTKFNCQIVHGNKCSSIKNSHQLF